MGRDNDAKWKIWIAADSLLIVLGAVYLLTQAQWTSAAPAGTSLQVQSRSMESVQRADTAQVQSMDAAQAGSTDTAQAGSDAAGATPGDAADTAQQARADVQQSGDMQQGSADAQQTGSDAQQDSAAAQQSGDTQQSSTDVQQDGVTQQGSDVAQQTVTDTQRDIPQVFTDYEDGGLYAITVNTRWTCLNIRKGGGVWNRVEYKAPKGNTGYLIAHGRSWSLIYIDGYIGYAYNKYLGLSDVDEYTYPNELIGMDERNVGVYELE